MLNKTLAFDSTDLSTQRNYYAATDASDLNVDYCTHATPNGPWETYDYANAAYVLKPTVQNKIAYFS